MEINSRVGIYYGILIDQYDAPVNNVLRAGKKKSKCNRITKGILVDILNSLFDFEGPAMGIEIDCDTKTEGGDFMVVYFKELSFVKEFCAESLTNKYLNMLKKPVPNVSKDLMKSVADELNKFIKTNKLSDVYVSQGFHIVSFIT